MKKKSGENPGEISEPIDQPNSEKKIEQTPVDFHRKAAAHSIEAAKHHLEAAKHHENGNAKKAARSSVLAYGHHTIAGEFLSDDSKHHAQTLKVTNYQ